MNNNDIFRRIRYTFDYTDEQIIGLFDLGGIATTRSEISAWLKKDDDADQKSLYDINLAAFLNGFIITHRGRKDGEQPKPEKSLTNNMIFRKLKIALNLKEEDIMHAFDLADFKVSKHEISAIFRKPTQKQYRLCKDQFLRNFLLGIQLKYRSKSDKKIGEEKKVTHTKPSSG